jgi:Phytanoyl-CoA dioxygenase (PhyH)
VNETFLDASSMGSRLRVMARKGRSAQRLATRAIHRLCSKSEFTWRYVANLRPWLEYQHRKEPMAATPERLLNQLIRDGIVITSVAELLGDTSLYDELEASLRKREADLADRIDSARKNIDIQGKVKSYLIPLLGSRPLLNPDDIFVRFALQRQLLGIVNGYFGMFAKLHYYNVWHNFATTNEPRESQMWHRDPEDRYILKVFVYFTDIDEGAGPLSYVPGTHARGDLKLEAPSTVYLEGHTRVRRSDDSQMSVIAPKSKWITALGPRGTAVLVDTTGYHKGGWARERDRILYTCMFTSKASPYPEEFDRKLPLSNYPDKNVAFALDI